MLFRKKGWLRKEFDDRLLENVLDLKESWLNQKQLFERSLEPSQEVQFQLKLAEAKYIFLYKEVKNRRITLHHK